MYSSRASATYGTSNSVSDVRVTDNSILFLSSDNNIIFCAEGHCLGSHRTINSGECFCITMLFNEFIEKYRNTLIGYYLLNKLFSDREAIVTPYPPSSLSDDELDELKEYINECIPLETIIVNLWDWDIRFEEILGDDWYFESVFGTTTSLEQCADLLAEFFLKMVDEYGMDYDQQNYGLEEFEQWIGEEVRTFISKWRKNIFNRFVIEESQIRD